MNWKINVWARLLDGNRALKLIADQIKPAGIGKEAKHEAGGTYPNMFDAHPPFQIDGNFGFTAGIAEMLVQSHDGAVALLPALPTVWTEGEVTGLVTRGGFVVDMQWQKNQLTYLKIHSRLGGNLRLRTYAPLPKAQQIKMKLAKGENPNVFFDTPIVASPLKHTEIRLPQLSLTNLFEVDVKTQAGRHYQWGQKKQ